MLTMSTSAELHPPRQGTAESTVRSVACGRTRVRSAVACAAQNISLPLGHGHSEDLHLCILAEGSAAVLNAHLSQASELGPQDCLEVIGAGPITVRALSDAEIVQLSIPRLAVEAPVPVETGTLVRAGSVSMTSPVLAFAREALLMDLEDASSLSIYYLERLLQEMAIGILVDHARSRIMPQSPAAFIVAQSVISSQCSDSGLRPALIAEQVGLSLRQLQRVFSSHDTTIEQEIRRERVEQAIAMLRSPDYAALTVTEIARYVGFSNGSGLARAMNALGVPSPRQVRSLSTSAAVGSERTESPQNPG